MDSGWVRLWRKSLHSTVWQDPHLWKLWTYCVMRANHSDKTTLLGITPIKLKRGQFIIGRKVLAETMNQGVKKEYRLSEKSWERRLKLLESMQMLSIKVTNKYSIITVINYDTYQNAKFDNDQLNDQQLTNNWSASDQQVTTDKNVKNVKNKYLEYVFLTEEEHEKLKEKLNSNLEDYIERLNNYIGSKGKRYNSHYHTILSWYRKDEDNKPLEVTWDHPE